MRLPLLVAALLSGSDGTQPADAIALRYEAPPSCPEVQVVREAIDSYMGRDEFGPGIREVRAEASIIRQDAGDRWRLEVEVEGPNIQASRSVTANDCGELGMAAGLLIAVALDPLRISADAPPPEDSQLESTSEPADEPAASGDDPPEPPLAGSVWASAGVGVPLLDGPTLLAELALALELPKVRVELGGTYVAPRELTPFPANPGVGARVQGGWVELGVCSMPTLGPLLLPTCAALGAGALQARGVGLSESLLTRRPWLLVSAEQQLVWYANSSVGLFVRGGALIHALRPRFEAIEVGDVVVVPAASAAFGAGVVGKF